MKICDLTQFYSPVSGGVKRYVSEKVRYLREQTRDDQHVLIIPGESDDVKLGERSRVYTIRSPLVIDSRSVEPRSSTSVLKGLKHQSFSSVWRSGVMRFSQRCMDCDRLPRRHYAVFRGQRQ